ncbi:MAG: hypothetical protein DRP00_02055, partial [Candidatus Aenigmatarchaeota archaeon]
FSSHFSISKVEKYFRSKGIRISKKTVSNYLKYFESAFFCFAFEKMSPKTRERVGQPRKLYSIDNIFYNLLPKFSEDLGKLMENLVAIKLFKVKSSNPLIDVFYWKDYQQREVDFVLKEGLKVRQLIQVSYVSGKDEIERREIKGLVKGSEVLKCKDLVLITWDLEDELKLGRKKVKCFPLWKWLLEVR